MKVVYEIQFSPEDEQRIQVAAEQLGMTKEELVRRALEITSAISGDPELFDKLLREMMTRHAAAMQVEVIKKQK